MSANYIDSDLPDYDKAINDVTNHAIHPNIYLELAKTEIDDERRFNLLKKYFTEDIAKNIYQNMDLLAATKVDFQQYKNMYLMIAKDISLKILLAVITLVNEKKKYNLDIRDLYEENDNNQSDDGSDDGADDCQYSICESYR